MWPDVDSNEMFRRIVGIDDGIFMRNLKRNMGKYIK